MNSYCGKFLSIDLGSGLVQDLELKEEMIETFLGGKGFGVSLLYDLVPEHVEPLSPDNALLFLTGPLTGTAAPSMRGVVVSKSPLTGTINDSYFGGHLGHEIKYAGYDGLIITGRANVPVYLYLGAEGLEIKEAGKMWGLDTYETYEYIKGELYDRTVKIACIGPAGEKMVPYACIDCDPHRQAGRGGAGAVMGSKNLKALIIKGHSMVPIANPALFQELLQTYYTGFPPEGNNFTIHGTPGSLDFANEMGFFPYKNYQDGVMPEGETKLGAPLQKKEFWLKDWACSGCVVRCSKIGKLKKGRFKGLIGDTTEYETLGLLGSNLGMANLDAVTYMGNLCDRLGLDSISTGGVLGFALECFERGIINSQDTQGLELKFGSPQEMITLILQIAKREGFGDVLAEGVKKAAERIGGGARDYAMEVKGLEVPAWTPRGLNAMSLAYMTNDRGACHLRAFGVPIETGSGDYPGGTVHHMKPEGIGPFVAYLQNMSSATWSLIQCELSKGALDETMLLQFLSAATGRTMDMEEFLTIGERIWNLTRLYNLREGFRIEDDDLPKRFKEEALPSGYSKGHKISEENRHFMLKEYYQARGWDTEGIPKQEKLEELKLNTSSDVILKKR